MIEFLSDLNNINVCARYFLNCSSKDRVVKALDILFHDKVKCLRHEAPSINAYVSAIEKGISVESVVNDEFLGKLQEEMQSPRLQEDFDLCRRYLSRTISGNYDLLQKLCEDELIGKLVKKKSDELVDDFFENLELTPEQTLHCFDLLLEYFSSEDGNLTTTIKDAELLTLADVYPDLEKYKAAFSSMKVVRRMGRKSPGKMIMLLTVIKMIEDKLLLSNRIYMSKELTKVFNSLWKQYVHNTDLFNCYALSPYWSMRTEGFWHVFDKDGVELKDEKDTRQMAYVRQHTRVYLDDDLYALLQHKECRCELQQCLISLL